MQTINALLTLFQAACIAVVTDSVFVQWISSPTHPLNHIPHVVQKLSEEPQTSNAESDPIMVHTLMLSKSVKDVLVKLSNKVKLYVEESQDKVAVRKKKSKLNATKTALAPPQPLRQGKSKGAGTAVHSLETPNSYPDDLFDYESSDEGSILESNLHEEPLRKNRPGQRARQKMWETKFGASAKHLARQAATTKRFPTSSRQPPDSNRRPPVTPSPAMSTENLHPSWVAKKKLKDAMHAKPQGEKIVFT